MHVNSLRLQFHVGPTKGGDLGRPEPGEKLELDEVRDACGVLACHVGDNGFDLVTSERIGKGQLLLSVLYMPHEVVVDGAVGDGQIDGSPEHSDVVVDRLGVQARAKGEGLEYLCGLQSVQWPIAKP